MQPLVKAAFLSIGLSLGVCSLVTGAYAFDEKRAKKTFKKCAACHAIGPNAKHKVGPQLNGLSGRVIGSSDGYNYSKALLSKKETGEHWNSKRLDQFLTKPKDYIAGNKMGFSGLKDESTREDLIDWLFSVDGDGISHVEVELKSTLLGGSAAELDGDIEFGEYIAGECSTCHSISGKDDGIPSIIGWPTENFIHVLYEYKDAHRDNAVMQSVAKRLTDEEMAALAAYYLKVTVN